MGYGGHQANFAPAGNRYPYDRQTRALTHWQEQEAAALADFMPIRVPLGAPGRSARFSAGWWIAPVLAASTALWGAAGWLILG